MYQIITKCPECLVYRFIIKRTASTTSAVTVVVFGTLLTSSSLWRDI